MARIIKDADGFIIGTSKSTQPGGCLGFIAFVIVLCAVVGLLMGH
jgi:hypothetical protein